jgi:hypothetical protein
MGQATGQAEDRKGEGMESITLKRAVTLVVIVTEEFKQQLKAEVGAAIDEVDRNTQQLDNQSRRYLLELQRTNLQQAMALRQRVDEERQRQNAMRTELERQLEEVDGLEIASEFRRGTLEGLVEVKAGDNLLERVNGAEIVIKDGIVQEFRYAALPALTINADSADIEEGA